jgi:hypothetical protein
MARTAIAVTELTAAGITNPAGTTIDSTLVTNGAYFIPTEPVEEYIVRVTNTHGTAHDVTIPAGDKPPAGESAPLTLACALTSGDILLRPNGSKHLQQGTAVADKGTIHVDFASGHTGIIAVLHLPRSF